MMANIFINKKHFGFVGGRWFGMEPKRWDRWWFRVGFAARTEEGWPSYRYWLEVHVHLLPNFIWYQDLLGIENGIMKVHNRIVGIQTWPFMRFCGGRP